jgi:outer membrane protein assembly factor BamB
MHSGSHRTDRLLSFRRWLLAVSLSAAPFAKANSIIDTSVLHSNETPAARAIPVRNPYFLGWSAEVTAPSGLFRYAREPGGVEIDLSSRSVFAGTRDGLVICLAAGGEERWRVDVGGSPLAAPTVFNEKLVVGTSEGVLYTLNKVTGEITAPRAILGEELITQPVVVEAGSGLYRAYVGSSAESVFAVDLETGQKLWRAHRDPPSGFTVFGLARPIVTPKSVFMSFADGVVEARDPATGALQWERHVSPPGDLLDVDGLTLNKQTLFAASYSGGIYALDPDTGAIKWHTPLHEASHVTVDGPYLYAGAPGQWVGMRAVDGVIGWRFNFGGGRTSTSAIVGERYLAFAEADGPMYFVDKRTGEPAGAFGTGEGFAAPATAVGPVVALLSNGGRVYTLTVVP